MYGTHTTHGSLHTRMQQTAMQLAGSTHASLMHLLILVCVHQFACLVEGCPHKANTRKGRQRHLTDKHSYPPNFTYDRRIQRAAKVAKARHKDKPTRKRDGDTR